MKITQEVRAFAAEQAERRCECSGGSCRHHLPNSRCKRGLRGDQWKVYWRSQDGGVTRDNIEAWCLDCFANNFEVPHETVVLLAPDIAGFARLYREDQRKAITLRSVLRDAADRAAGPRRGRMVLDRLDDDVLLEFAKSWDAVQAAHALRSDFRDMTRRLDLPTPDLCGAIHRGKVTRWRNGLLVGDAVEIATQIREIAAEGQLLLTDDAAEPIRSKMELEAIPEAAAREISSDGGIWALPI